MGLNPEALGRTIGEIRKARGLTQRQVAEHTGLTVNYLSLVENGQRGVSVEVVNQLADVFGLPSELILFLAGDGGVNGDAGAFADLIDATKGAIRALIEAEAVSPVQ